MMMSMLKYKHFGRAMRSRTKSKSIRNSIADTIKIQQDADKLSLYDLTVKQGVLGEKKQEMLDAAKLIYQGDLSDSKMFRLHELFKLIETLQQECKVLSKTREALSCIRVAKDKEMATVILEKHVLNEHNKRKINRAIRPSLKSIGIKATRLQMDKDLEQDFREEMSSFGKDDELDETEEHYKDDQRFSDWLDTLKSPNLEKGLEEQTELTRRIAEMKKN